MERIKLDRYAIYEKGRRYEVIVFPFVKNMWVYEGNYDESGFVVDGSIEAFMNLKIASAILANDPYKIIYFPCKQNGMGPYYANNYNLLLYRPELQFRRSRWYRIKKHLNKRHKIQKYCLRYERKKLNDYYEKGLWKHYRMRENDYGEITFPRYVWRKEWKEKRKLLGDTVFIENSRAGYYAMHYHTDKDIIRFQEDNQRFVGSMYGWIIPDKEIRKMYEEYKKEEMLS